MLSFKEIENLVDGLVDLITITSEGLAQSRERAGQFLMGQAVLTNYLRETVEELAKLATLKDATYAQTLRSVEGANVTEKKINVLEDVGYAKYREEYETLESNRDWAKRYIQIFDHAHILYRSLSRESG